MMREATNERSLRRTLLLAIACTLAAVHTLPCAAQPPLEFDVASIKRAPPGPGNTTMKFEPGGRFRATGAPLNALIQWHTESRISRSPDDRNGPTPNPTNPTMSSPSRRPV